MTGGDCFVGLWPPRNDASIGGQPPLDWQERLAEETPDIVMAAFGHPRLPSRRVKDVAARDKQA
jgi:hypothetical protein